MTNQPVPAQLHCDGCNRRIGRRGRVLVIAASVVVFGDCCRDRRTHRAVFPGCRPDHDLATHGGCHVSRARALQRINSA